MSIKEYFTDWKNVKYKPERHSHSVSREIISSCWQIYLLFDNKRAMARIHKWSQQSMKQEAQHLKEMVKSQNIRGGYQWTIDMALKCDALVIHGN